MKAICSIDGCNAVALCRGWCSRHYERWKLHGDPLAGRTREGEPLEWLQAHKDWAGDACLIFPYARNDKGYGAVLFDGKVGGAHRAMCHIAHGAAPTPQHVAAHSCGKGTDGCVHPQHLRWATHEDNALDLTLHREAGVAPPSPSRLTSEQCRSISDLRGKERLKATAARFGISESMVCRIQRGNRRQAAIKRLA